MKLRELIDALDSNAESGDYEVCILDNNGCWFVVEEVMSAPKWDTVLIKGRF
jgi:hypothetical protein